MLCESKIRRCYLSLCNAIVLWTSILKPECGIWAVAMLVLEPEVAELEQEAPVQSHQMRLACFQVSCIPMVWLHHMDRYQPMRDVYRNLKELTHFWSQS